MKSRTKKNAQPVEQQVYHFIAQSLMHMNILPVQIDEEAHLFFDLDIGIRRLDFLFSLLEKRFQLHTPLVYNTEIASLKGLANYVGHKAMAA